jgi:hypothetical protein
VRLVVERSYLLGVLPKLEMMTAKQLIRLLNGYPIICAFFRFTRVVSTGRCNTLS